MKTKQDELDLMKLALKNTNAEPFKRCFLHHDSPNINGKRFAFILEKWYQRGWFECGVSLGTGWLTVAGVLALQNMLIETEASKDVAAANK